MQIPSARNILELGQDMTSYAVVPKVQHMPDRDLHMIGRGAGTYK